MKVHLLLAVCEHAALSAAMQRSNAVKNDGNEEYASNSLLHPPSLKWIR